MLKFLDLGLIEYPISYYVLLLHFSIYNRTYVTLKEPLRILEELLIIYRTNQYKNRNEKISSRKNAILTLFSTKVINYSLLVQMLF